MKPKNTRFVLCAFALGLGAFSQAQSGPFDEPNWSWKAQSHSQTNGYTMVSTRSMKGMALHDAMRKLWEDHVTWTRLFIVSAVGDLPDKQATTDRLLQNQTDIGDAVKPYYGTDAGNRLTALLREHILLAAGIVTPAKQGDTKAVESGNAKWFANADEIAAFLSKANPKQWRAAEMRDMMHDHLALTLAEAVAQIKGDYSASARAYDKVHVQILSMADMLTEGLMAQFPDKFRDTGR